MQTFYQAAKDEVGLPIACKRGWKKASVFLGFCARHDALAFAPLENQLFTGSPEQLFLIAYRAHCHELYQKQSVIDTEQLMRESRPLSASLMFDRVYAGYRKALSALQQGKSYMDKQIMSTEYAGWSCAIFYMRGPLAVTGTGAITPNYDFEQNELQQLFDPASINQYLYFAVIPGNEEVVFAFVWNSQDEAPRQFVSSLSQRPVGHLANLLLQFVFAYCENAFFSEAWWNALCDDQRRHIRQLAGTPNPYYSLMEFKNDGLAPWTFDRLQINS